MALGQHTFGPVEEQAVNPTVNDDSSAGFDVGTVWVNTATDAVFISADVSVGAAVWVGPLTSTAHVAVTLAADAETILGLVAQELTLDPQIANLVFAGPTAGGAVDPTFRSLVDADIPAIILRDAEHTAIGDAAPHHLAAHAHSTHSGLLVDDHTIYAILVGRAGSQTLQGGTLAGEYLTLRGNAAALDGSVFLGSSALFKLQESTGQLLLPTTGAAAGILIGGDTQLFRSAADILTLAAGDRLEINDANFWFSIIGGNPRITSDAGDYAEFNRAANHYSWFVGSTEYMRLNAAGGAGGGLADYDLQIGNVGTPTYGNLRFGDAVLARVPYNALGMDLDGSVIIRNVTGPVTGQIEFAFLESGASAVRFALPKSGVGNATYNSRSMLIAGPAVWDDDIVTVGYWQTVNAIFHNLACDTVGTGADLGVQNDLEVEGDIFTDSIKESTPSGGVMVEGHLFLQSGDESIHRWDTGDEQSFDTVLNRYVVRIAGLDGIVATPTVLEINFIPLELQREITLVADDITYTSSINLIDVASTITLDAPSIFLEAFNFHPTIILEQDPNFFGMAVLLNCAPLIKNPPGEDSRFGIMFSFIDQTTIQVDTVAAATDMPQYRSFTSLPFFDAINGGSMTLTDWYQYYAGVGQVASGFTINNRFGFIYFDANPAFGGSMGTQVGVDIEFLDFATTNIGIRNASILVHTPVEQVFAAVGTQMRSDATVVEISSSIGSITLTNAAVIANGQDGQELKIINIDAVDTITIPNGNNTRLAGAANLALGPADSVSLIYSASLADWVQVAASNN